MATLTVALATSIVYTWTLADPARVEDVLFLSSASLYREPWRILTSTFIHHRAPHFAFNLLTLLWFGRAVERTYGKRIFTITFFGALWTGQMVTLLVDGLALHGISGGICGLYGLLLVARWNGSLYRTLNQEPAYWLYPAALVALFVADRLGLTPVATLNHVVAMADGGLTGLAMNLRNQRIRWMTVTATVTVAATISGAYRSERPWQDLPSLIPLDCAVIQRPIGDVTRNEFVRVIVNDRSPRQKSIYYIDANGGKVRVSTNSRRTYRLLPYVGTVWRTEEANGACRAQFEATKSGIITLE